MASAATLATIGQNPKAAPHIFTKTFGTQPTANGAPIVFLIPGDVSERDWLESQIRCEGWKPEAFESAQEFLARPRPLVPSCLLLLISPSSLNGLEIQKRIAPERPETSIIVISGYADVSTTVQAMKAGAVEFLTRPFNNDALLGAIRESLERSRLALDREIEISNLRNCYVSLTRRERQVLKLLVSGLLNKQVGGELGISEITVKVHRRQVMQKMKADSFAELVIKATRLAAARFMNIQSLLQGPVQSEGVS